MSALDQPREVRPGDELELERLGAYLEASRPELAGSLVVLQFPSGYSNLTYLLRANDREVVLRRPPRGATIATAHDMGREYRILSALAPVTARVPRPLCYCEDASVLGAPFYLMERVPGVILRARAPQGVDLGEAVMRRLSKAAVDVLVEIHGIDYAAVGLGDLGRPEGYVARQIRGWSERYARARTDDVPDVERAAAWLEAHLPRECAPTLLHNDFKYDNLVLDPGDLGEVRAVLDWEMATLGDPRMDLGTSLGYWVDPDDPEAWQAQKFGLTTLPGNLRRAEVAERYAARSGRDLDDPVFFYAYALFKLAVVVQQIYRRYRDGHSRDERFARLIDAVRACGKMAMRAVELGRIDGLG